MHPFDSPSSPQFQVIQPREAEETSFDPAKPRMVQIGVDGNSTRAMIA